MAIDIDMIGIVTKDRAESIRFYRSLGLEIPDPDPGSPYHEITLPSGVRFSWNNVEMVKEIDPEWVEPAGQRLSYAFLCENPSGVDKVHAGVVANGFKSHMDPFDAFWGQRYAVLVDPDGIYVDLFAPLGGT